VLEAEGPPARAAMATGGGGPMRAGWIIFCASIVGKIGIL